MPKINVTRKVVIDKPAKEVFSQLNDFHNWQSWSPWLVLEKEATVDVKPDGKYYEWTGDIIGSGNMTVEDEVENKSINYDLTFLKPWKSKAKTDFTLNEKDGKTELTWNLSSSLPFFLFFMKSSMEGFIGMDYERGLSMLKAKIEKGEVPTKLDIDGMTNFDATKYIGIKRSTSFAKMPTEMEGDYSTLMPLAHNDWKECVNGNAFTIYHNWDVKNKRVEYTACVPVNKVPTNLDSNMIVGEVPATKVHKVTHTGSYNHIGNAWSAQMMRQQGKKFKGNKNIHPMEVYLNSPKDTPENELKAEILFAVK